MAEKKGMISSPAAGVSRLDKNQSPSFDQADRRPSGRPAAVETSRFKVATPLVEPAHEAPPKTESVPEQLEPASKSVEPFVQPPPVEPGPCDGPTISQRILLITALTTLFWAPLAWILNWMV